MNFLPASDFITRNGMFILTAHETPDGDAIGAEVALYFALLELGKKVRILNADPTPRIFQFIDQNSSVEVLTEATLPKDLSDWALLIVDTNDINNIGILKDLVIPHVREYFILDHHEGEGDLHAGNLIEVECSSTCELLSALFLEMHISVTYPIALALFSGIVYDTGSFVYPKTSARTFGIAQKLLECGVKPYMVYAKMYESNTVSSLVLRASTMATLSLHFNEKVSVLKMTKEKLLQSNAPYEEAQTFINIPLKSENIRVSVFFKENEEGVLRCSLRSKGDIDVAAIAREYGGGGHKNAAGFKSNYSLNDIETRVLGHLKQIV